MPILESDVLRPMEPSLNELHWAEFVLSNASVVYESNGKPASLLLAYPDTLLKVQGRLETPAQKHSYHLLKKPYKPTEIVVRNVTRYCYGQMTDGSCGFWALGEAGWFEIRPAAHFKAIFDDMVQAVELLYFVTDIYNEPRKRGGGPSAALIYQEYAEDPRFPCNDIVEAEGIFRKHREFLLLCFVTRAHDIGWSNTPLYQTFRRTYPKEFERCKARSAGRPTDVKTSRTRTSPAPVPSAKAQTSRGSAVVAKADEPPKKDDNWWEAATLFAFMQRAVNQRVIRAGRNSITVDRVAQLIIRRFEIEDVQVARNILLVHAQSLCYMMDHPRRRNIRFFAAEPIYGELRAGHSLPAAEQRRAEGMELRPRKHQGRLQGEESESSDTDDEEDEEDEEDDITTPQHRAPRRSQKGTLSVLRPKSGKSSTGKSVQRAGKGKTKPPIPVSDSDSADDMPLDTPTHALSPAPKRKLSTSSPPHAEKRKRTHSASPPPSSPPRTASASPAPSAAAVPLRARPPTAPSTLPLLPALASTPLPTYTPNGPRDSWLCGFDGCAQRIYGCSKEGGRALITEHLEDHSKGREKAVGILWREQEASRLPVDNLIKRIREMGEAGTPLFPAEARAQARPIERAA
ncbi:hypothetical protein C7974DRAFT_327439 [Boeremia exigua]|uniref:uncharacterized protein n=1 Tax=Boeremia exigua TaxID=749465 RepID=UPI001E8D739B|nr:uncharacterized protein C7974DRAFT_327439 [Boeremia exigua]KAH6642301.1 hypothetical protein C7974DRAFT_327439 [Boeremia exigua]